MSTGWVVARTKPSRERWAAENIARQGYEYYLPCVLSQSALRGRTHEVRAIPLFASYIFVHTQDRWRSLLGTFGVASVLMSNNRPCLMPETEIQKLRRLEENGVVQLPDVLKPGKTQLRVTAGPFQGQVGLYQGQDDRDRVKVLLDFLGGKRPVLIKDDTFEVVP